MTSKGRISTVATDGRTATVVPAFGEVVSHPLVVPLSLRGQLTPGVEVVYCSFPDTTGIILCRMDGNA